MSQQYPQQPYQPQPAPKKKHTVRNVFIVLGVLAVLGIGGCFAVVGSVGHEIDKQSKTTHQVVYKVTATGTTKADLTYTTDGSTTTEQVQGATLPWTKSLEIKGGFVSVYQVMAQNAGTGGAVTCSISVDGKAVKTARAVGQGAIASCDYTP